jgi:hypothetical protein
MLKLKTHSGFHALFLNLLSIGYVETLMIAYQSTIHQPVTTNQFTIQLPVTTNQSTIQLPVTTNQSTIQLSVTTAVEW